MLRQTRECLLGGSNVFAMHGFAQEFATIRTCRKRAGLDGMQHFIFAPASFLNAIGVSV